jgi:hypothetical protein
MTNTARALILALTAAALLAAAPAQADVLHGGNWSGRLTGGSVKLGDGVLPAGYLDPGGTAAFIIAPYSSAVGFSLAGTSAHFGNFVREAANGTGDEYTASGNLNLSVIDAQVDPSTGAVFGTLSASGTISVAGRTLAQGQQTGSFSGTCEVREAAMPGPVPLAVSSRNPGGTPWSLASGTVTLTDPASAIPVTCPNLPSRIGSELFGSTDAGHNAVSLGAALTPSETVLQPPGPIVTPPPPIGPQRRPCVVPEVRGALLDNAKKAIKKASCGVGRIRRRHSSVKAPDTVLKQWPKAGTHKKAGYPVRLWVAK